jgi:hypothetical protein
MQKQERKTKGGIWMLKPQRRNHRFGQSLDKFEKATKVKNRKEGVWKLDSDWMTSQQSIPKGKEQVRDFIAITKTHRQRWLREKRTINPKPIHKSIKEDGVRKLLTEKMQNKKADTEELCIPPWCLWDGHLLHSYFLLQNSTQSSS